ncbi:MAG: 16S rRNA (cytidine(1402)-2'-O)-methyltransferase [Hyphomonadaceae bacterium]|nr:16S rRNA (cytidine(1402)-2'-O)-methyltransferase [Hyphomonadaceae bacterium]
MSDSSTPAKFGREPIGAGAASPPLEPGLYVVATPIGNLRDITLRALDVLGAATRVYAEDTRVARKLLDAYGLKPKLAAYHEHNAEAARETILAALAGGESVALISDAGTPLISDPGYKLAREAAASGHRVIPIPGASALLAGLVVSGLPTDRFLFAGFLPSKHGARVEALTALAPVDTTLVLFETGPRLADSLADMARALGDRNAAIGRELTKLFEEVRRGTLSQLAAHYANADPPKGEIVVVIGPPLAAAEVDDATLDAYLRPLIANGVKDAAQSAADTLNVPRRRAYARALALKGQA